MKNRSLNTFKSKILVFMLVILLGGCNYFSVGTELVQGEIVSLKSTSDGLKFVFVTKDGEFIDNLNRNINYKVVSDDSVEDVEVWYEAYFEYSVDPLTEEREVISESHTVRDSTRIEIRITNEYYGKLMDNYFEESGEEIGKESIEESDESGEESDVDEFGEGNRDSM